MRKKQSTLARFVRNENEINFNDSDWKKHFQHDFESRFNLPHLRDVVDIRPRPTTFSLRNRLPILLIHSFLLNFVVKLIHC